MTPAAPYARTLDALRAARLTGDPARARDAVERIDWGRLEGGGSPGEGPLVRLVDGRWFGLEGERLSALLPERDRALPAAVALEGWLAGRDAEVLAYRPGRRLVLRVRDRADGAGGPRIYKAFRRGRLRRALERHRRAERAAAGSALWVPAVVEVHEALDLVEFELLEGRAPGASGPGELTRALRTLVGTLTDRFALTASARTRTEQGSGELPRHGPRQELDVLDQMLGRVTRLRAEAPPGWQRARRRVEQRFAPELVLAGERWAFAHRDLHDGQLVLAGDRVGLFDFDLACWAEAALDPANLAAHFELRELQGALGPGRGSELSATVEAAYGEHGGASARTEAARFELYRSTTLLRLALVYWMRPRWEHLTPALIQRAEQAARTGAGSQVV